MATSEWPAAILWGLLVALVQLVGEVEPAVVGADGELAVVGVALEEGVLAELS